MVMVRLHEVYRVIAKGRTYYYAWKGKGAPRLKSEPGSPAFIAELEAIQAARFAVDKTTVRGLIALFRDSETWKEKLAPKTRAEWGRWLDRVEAHFEDTKLSSLLKEHPDPQKTGRFAILQWRKKYRKTPRAADMGMQAFSRLCAFGVDEGLMARNPCVGIKREYTSNRAEVIWRPADFERLEPHASKELMWAAKLAAQTGLRRGDLIRLAWTHIRSNHIEIATGKSGGKRTVMIPIGAELRTLIDSIPRRATTVLTNTDGHPWKTGFAASWSAAIKRAKITGLRFHDLRGTAATRLFLSGFSIREIAETMGWSEDQVEKLINIYVKRDEIILRRIAKLDENASSTDTEKLREKLSGKGESSSS